MASVGTAGRPVHTDVGSAAGRQAPHDSAESNEIGCEATPFTIVKPIDPLRVDPATSLQWGRTLGVMPSPCTARNPLVAPYQFNQGP
jgi:hypothetical protein